MRVLLPQSTLLNAPSPSPSGDFPAAIPHRLWHHRYASSHLELVAPAAYEAHRKAHDSALPPREHASEHDRQAWLAAMSAALGKNAMTCSDAAANRSLHIQAGDERHVFNTDVIVGREGTLVISDEFTSGKHARFWVARGRWYVEDVGSTNGTWLNGRRIHAAQLLKRGDKIRIGHTIMTVTSA